MATNPQTLNDCGCVATVYADGSGVDIEFCPLHLAAPDLLAALCEMLVQFDALATLLDRNSSPSTDQAEAFNAAVSQARTAIAKAGVK